MIQNTLDRADRSRLEPIRCGGKADDSHLGVDDPSVGQEMLVHALGVGAYQMGFIDQDQIETVQLAGTLVDRLDTSDDHWMIGITPL